MRKYGNQNSKKYLLPYYLCNYIYFQQIHIPTLFFSWTINLLDAKIFGLNDPERTRWASGGRWLGLERNVARLFDELGIGPMCRLRWTSVNKGKKYYFLAQLKIYYRGECSVNKTKSFCSLQSFGKKSSFFLNRICTYQLYCSFN